jgi:hypothetical protein
MLGGDVFKYSLLDYLLVMSLRRGLLRFFGFRGCVEAGRGLFKCLDREGRGCYVLVKISRKGYGVVRRRTFERLRGLGLVYVILMTPKGAFLRRLEEAEKIYVYGGEGLRRVGFSRLYPFLNGRRVQINVRVDGETYFKLRKLKAELTRRSGRIYTWGEVLWVLIGKYKERKTSFY